MKADRHRRPPAGRPAPRPGGRRGPPPEDARRAAGRRADVLIAAALFVGSVLLYLPVLYNGRVDYDDPEYIGRPMVLQGLTLQGVRWAFTTTTFGNWLPVTWLSHMLDVQWFGTQWGGHHATSAVLHAINAVLLFLSLRTMTGKAAAAGANGAPAGRWPSAVVASLMKMGANGGKRLPHRLLPRTWSLAQLAYFSANRMVFEEPSRIPVVRRPASQ